MALFDNFSRTVNGAIEGARQRNSENNEITKLRVQISELSKQRREECRALGDRYYRLFKDSPAPELSKLVETIGSMDKQIDLWNKQIRLLRGLVSCPKCHAEMDRGAMFCINCGERIIPEDATLCPNCGSVLPAGALFCTSCGAKILNPTVEDKSEYSEGVNEQPEQDITKAQCPNCGAKLSEDDAFCTVCGTRVSGEN